MWFSLGWLRLSVVDELFVSVVCFVLYCVFGCLLWLFSSVWIFVGVLLWSVFIIVLIWFGVRGGLLFCLIEYDE